MGGSIIKTLKMNKGLWKWLLTERQGVKEERENNI